MKKIFIFTVLSIVVIFLTGQNVLAIGQVTEPIVVENMLRGQEITAILNLFNSEEEEIVYGLTSDGDIADWTSFYKIEDKKLENPVNEVLIPAKSYLNVTVKFKVPDDMPNGEYNGKAYVFTKPKEDDGSSEIKINVGQRIGRKVSITVTDQEIFNFDTTIIPLEYQVEQGEPLQVKTIYENKGNVTIQPDIHFKVTKDETVVFNAILLYPENEVPIRPFERRTFPSLIEWQTAGQTAGHYKVEIKVLINDEVFQEKSFGFNIGSSGQVLGTSNMKIIWPLLGAGLIIVLVLVFLTVKKRLATAK